MKVHRGFSSLSPDSFIRPVATIGVFDGVHLGHRAVIDATRDLARELAGESVAVTFNTHPRRVLEGRAPALLTSIPHRLALLERTGLDHAVILPFDETVRRISAADFAERVFAKGIGIRGLVLGFDSSFGRNREGDLEFARAWAEGRDVVVRSAPPVLVGGRPISSSVIRAAIAAGEHERAQAMLGRPVAVYGRVHHGRGRGREIGVATATLDIEGELTPPAGVYAAWTRVRGSWRPSLVNIGHRPTFEAEDAPIEVEVHVPGMTDDLYGEEMEVQFIERIRDEQRFDSKEALVARIREDQRELERIVARKREGRG